MFRVRTLAALLCGIVFFGYLVLIVAGLFQGKLDLSTGLGVMALGALAIASFFLCIAALDSGEGFSIETHWGGLGGGVGGWRLSLPLVFLLATLFFAGLATTMAVASGPPPENTSSETEATEQGKTTQNQSSATEEAAE